MRYLSKFLLENGKIRQVFYLDADNGKPTLKGRQVDKFISMPNFEYIAENKPNKYTIFKHLKRRNFVAVMEVNVKKVLYSLIDEEYKKQRQRKQQRRNSL